MDDSYAQFETFLAKGVLASAEAVARHMLVRGPTDELAHVAAARMLIAKNQHAAALAGLQKLNPGANGMSTAMAWMGEVHLFLKQDAEAEKCATAALAMDPYVPPGLRLKAKLLIKAGKHAEAVPILGGLVKSVVAETEDWRSYALVLRKTKMPDAAVQALQHVVAAKPTDIPAWTELIRARMEAGEAETALTELQAFMGRHPRNPDVLKFASEVRQMGTTTSNPMAGEIAAIRDLVDAGDIAGAGTRVQTLLKYHRPTRALKFIMEEVALANPANNPLEIKVRVIELNRQYKEAWEPRALLADILLRSGKAAEAITAITYAEEAWNMSGGNPRVGLRLLRAYKMAGKLPYANALAAQLRALSPAVAARVDAALR
jgi:tetratricopeptide (TPR) repeat protein